MTPGSRWTCVPSASDGRPRARPRHGKRASRAHPQQRPVVLGEGSGGLDSDAKQSAERDSRCELQWKEPPYAGPAGTDHP